MPRTTAARTPATPAKKTPTKKATGTRTPRTNTTAKAAAPKAPAKKTTTRKTAATEPGKATKKATTTAARTKTTPAAVKKATAWPEFITHKMINAHYQARLHGLPTRNIRDWRELPAGIAALHFPSGARLDHTPEQDAPFHALTPCPHGHIHRHPCRTPGDLTQAQQTAKDCTEHAEPGRSGTQVNIAITRVTSSAPVPAPSVTSIPRPLGDQLTHSTTDTTDTQPLSAQEIADTLTARADHEQPKGHPEP